MPSPRPISPISGNENPPDLNEDLALARLKQPDLAPEAIEQLSKNSLVSKSRKVKLAIVTHPKTPRYTSATLIRQLFTFDLMRVALTPVAPGDIKRAAEDVLIHRLESVSLGERLSLARRASGRVAAELLQDSETRVFRAALQNSRLTESSIVRMLLREGAAASFVTAVCQDGKWSLRREVRIALLRNEKTPMARAVEFARSLPAKVVRETLRQSRLPANVRDYVLKEIASKT